MTLSNHQTIRGVTLMENGLQLDTRGDAGPAFMDYSAVFNKLQGYVFGETGEPNGLSRKSSREFNFVICDGRYLGAIIPEDAAIPSELYQTGFTVFNGMSYVVFKDLQWEVTFITPSPADSWVYGEIRDENNFISFPRQSTMLGGDVTFDEWLDDQTTDAAELVGANVWLPGAEMFKFGVASTLMKCPLLENNESIVDMSGIDNDGRSELLLAPLGLHLADYFSEPTDVPDVDAQLLGINQSDQWWNHQFRANEPYDKLRGVMLARDAKTLNYRLPNYDTAQQEMSLDVDDAIDDAYQFVGIETFPQWSRTPSTFTVRGRFRGEIVISEGRPWPLVLSIQSLPIKIRTERNANGANDFSAGEYVRPHLTPIRWNITANVKMR